MSTKLRPVKSPVPLPPGRLEVTDKDNDSATFALDEHTCPNDGVFITTQRAYGVRIHRDDIQEVIDFLIAARDFMAEGGDK